MILLRFVAAGVTALLLSVPVQAATACLLISDVATGEVLVEEGHGCEERIGPASTFKLTLAAIGFDAGILSDAEEPAWPYKESYRAVREVDRRTTTPRSWMANSVLWYSRELVRKLGADGFADYIRRLDYGNMNVSGDPGADNGMTHAWLNTSLLISPAEQLRFVQRLLTGDLPIKPAAVELAMSVTPNFVAGGWSLKGKTGTGYQRENGKLGKRQYGWFIGWGTDGERRLAFAYLIKDKAAGGSAAGPRARDDLLERWPELLGGE